MHKKKYDYEKFFELTPDLLCIAGFDGYFKKVNAAVSNTLGYSYEELYTRPINVFIHPDDVERTSKVREGLTASETLYNFENRYITKTGEVVWLSWTSQPSVEDQLIFAIAKNITLKKKIELVKDTEFTHLVKSNDAFKQLSYTTSHDLRSPLDSLLAVFNLIDMNLIEDEKTHELINILKRGGEKLKSKVDNYISVLKNTDDPNSNTEDIIFEEVLKSVLSSLQTLISQTNIIIKSDFSGLKSISFNKDYIDSIFLNLISNAIKFRRNNVSSQLLIYTKIEGFKKQLIFKDNGLGFNMKEVNGRIFELNQTFHKNTDSKGIGLYLVKKHLQTLGAGIEVESEEGKGTNFTITFKD